MKVTRRGRAWLFGILATAAIAVGVVWAVGSGDTPMESAGSDGYLGLKLLLERQGATVADLDGDDVTAATAKRYDVVFVPRADGVDRAQLAQWHRYVAAGGRLVLGEPDTTRPSDADAPKPAETVAPGNCTIEGAGSIASIHTGGVGAHHIHSNEQSCFGNGSAALLTSATCQLGAQFTLSSPSVFDNETMGAPTEERLKPQQRGNAALATLVLAPTEAARVAIVTDGVRLGFGDSGPAKTEPKCADRYDDDALWQDPSTAGDSDASDKASSGKGTHPGGSVPGGSTPGSSAPGQSIPGDTVPGGDTKGGSDPSGSSGGAGGQPNGDGKGSNGSDEAGTAKPPPSIWDFLSPGLKLALAQLFAVLVWFAWRRSRRRGVLVEERQPVELRSSRLVEAVGALRRRGGETERAGQELRERARQQLAVSVGLGADAGSAEVAQALAPRLGRPVDDVTRDLLGPPVQSEEALVALAARLHALRDELAATLTSGRARS